MRVFFFANFQRKRFKTHEKLRRAVCDSFQGTKQFSVVFVLYHVFEGKKVFSFNSEHIYEIATF